MFKIVQLRSSHTNGVVLAGLATGVLLAALGGTVAHSGREVGRVQNPKAEADLARAELVTALRTSTGKRVSAWTAQTADGRRCSLFQVDDGGTTTETLDAGSAQGFCPTNDGLSQRDRRAMVISWLPNPAGGFNVIVEGSAAPASGITRFAVESAAGPVASVASTRGFVLAELPVVASHGDVPAGGPYLLVGYDRAGNAITRESIDDAITQGRPS
jgi:hypothetical protein